MNNSSPKSILVIGAGIAGLSAGIYARLNGYSCKIFEMHDLPGGLMTAWKRKGYTIDGCIHWLTGSSPESSMYSMWEEIGLIQGRTILNPEIFSHYEGKNGEVLNLYTDVERLEQHLLELAPEDAKAIRSMCASIRAFTRFNRRQGKGLGGALKNTAGFLRVLPEFLRYGRLSMKDFSMRFKHPFLRRAFTGQWMPEISAVAFLMTLAWLHNQDAGYPLGGSLPMARAVEKRFLDLGGEIFYDSRVSKILVEPLPDGKSAARGVRLADGREERADIIISAADGHASIYEMLEGRFVDRQMQSVYDSYPTFPSLLFIGLGVSRQFDELKGITGGISLELQEPLFIAGEKVEHLDTMIYNFDPSLAPEGKTVLTVMIPSPYAYWKELHQERERYDAEKEQAGLQVIQRLEQRFPGLAPAVEMADVATPVTFERYTGNWKGSFEGWLPTPKTVTKPIPRTLPGLEDFYMVGQWVQPGGGLPSGVMTGREVLGMICKKDRKKFSV